MSFVDLSWGQDMGVARDFIAARKEPGKVQQPSRVRRKKVNLMISGPKICSGGRLDNWDNMGTGRIFGCCWSDAGDAGRTCRRVWHAR